MNSDEESPVTRFITHDETPWTTLSRRSRGSDDVYHRQVPSSATVSVASSPNEVFSSREPSIATRPTSYGASYPAHGYNKEGRGNTVYAASLSATHGSESEPEAELSDALDAALLGTGAWSASHQAQGQLLRRHEHAKVRLSKSLPHRVKKLPVVLHQNNAGVVSAHDGTEPRTDITSMSNRQGTQRPTQDSLSNV
ncbi:hypothetical protein E8E12_010564 [Didymella heteroderae]|uniref:Uncharacterized protein n=1 Tax=Didymella heteroderae TaxID=1769908 RepID=A0A9P4WXC0_9PLEO|nr:hypothetical protein E8E12_010564 [Didymella heteroderae]